MSKSFTEQTSTNDKDLLLVDSLNLAFRWKHSGAKNFVDDYISTVLSLAKSYRTSNILILADHGSSSYRKSIYPEYKQNRKDKFAEQTPAEQKAFEDFFKEFTATLEELKNSEIPVLRFPGVEADDLAAYIVSKKEKYSIGNIWLISSDRDWDLLVTDDVSRFSYVTRKEITKDNWNTHYDCTPEEYISIKCLMGDSGDNVLGVPGIGPKRALSLVQEYGSALDIAAELPIFSKYKYVDALNKFGTANIMLNYKLMDLVSFCQEAVGQENLKEVNKVLEEIYGSP